MHVIRNTDVTSEDGKEKISANDFYVDIEDVSKLDDKEIIALSNAQAWNPNPRAIFVLHHFFVNSA